MFEIGAFSLYSPSTVTVPTTGASVDAITPLLEAADEAPFTTSAKISRSLLVAFAIGLGGSFVFGLDTEKDLVIVCRDGNVLGSRFRAT